MNKKATFLTILILLVSVTEFAYSQKYWVRFTDKNGTPYSVSSPGAFLSAKAIQRRSNQGIAIDQADLPVTPSYVSQVAAVSGVTVLYRSKWLNGVVVAVTNTAAISTINTFTFVSTTGPVNKYKFTTSLPSDMLQETVDNPAAKTQNPTNTYYGPGWWQAKMIGADCLHYFNFKGQGMTIAVLDAGFLNVNTSSIYDSLFMQNRLLGTRDFVTGDTMVFEDYYHGAAVLSTMAAYKQGVMVGTAPKANYWLLRTEDASTETISEEYNWIRGAEFADSVGADVCTTSLGYTTFDGGTNNHSYSQLDGKTAPMSIAATMAARKGMLVLNAAGNEGCFSPGSCWYYIAVPADADSIVTVGAVDSLKNKAGFSSFGPTADGRIKPDVCARGANAYVCSGGGCYYGNGTSFATPIMAGALTCLWQYKKFATNIQIINAVKASGSNSSSPNNNIGWGIPDLCAAMSNTLLTVAEQNQSQAFSVYPNPFNSTLKISLKHPTSSVSVRVYDVLGKEVLNRYFENEMTELHVGEIKDITAGVYFITVSSPDFNSTQKIIRQ